MAFVYILESQKDKTYYVGSSKDVLYRITQHNAGIVRSTKTKRPWMLAFAKEFATIGEARKFEAKIKSWKKRTAIENFISRESSIIKVGP